MIAKLYKIFENLDVFKKIIQRKKFFVLAHNLRKVRFQNLNIRFIHNECVEFPYPITFRIEISVNFKILEEFLFPDERIFDKFLNITRLLEI